MHEYRNHSAQPDNRSVFPGLAAATLTPATHLDTIGVRFKGNSSYWGLYDNDESDGYMHTNFKLGGSGGEIGLFGRLAAGNEEIDSYAFGAQSSNISEGRATDGAGTWTPFTVPTPGAGGVESILIQLAKKLTGLNVIATASSPDTQVMNPIEFPSQEFEDRQFLYRTAELCYNSVIKYFTCFSIEEGLPKLFVILSND